MVDAQAWTGVSDGLLVMALAGYLTAMVIHAAELVVRQRLRVTVPTTASTSTSTDVRGTGPYRWIGPAPVAVTAVAVATHAGSVLARGLAAERVPLGNMYEFILTAGLASAVAWLVLLARRPVRELGVFVLLAIVLLLGVAVRLYTRVEPLVPALASPWLRVHVGTAALATGLLLVGFVATVLYLLRLRQDAAVAARRMAPGTLGRLPRPEPLDRVAQRIHQVAFPIWTFAILAGAIWAEAAWGRYWGWDPKEVWAFVSWVLYACYLHARSTAGWRGRPAALVAVVAWVTMLVNLFVVNLAFPGLHSYAGF